jgi:predicted nucleic acid-binding protein
VQLVIADTGPINYLILIRCIDVIPALFEKVLIPSTVKNELAASQAPLSVRYWIASLPAWLDDRKGESAALRKGLTVTDTLGILDLAAHRGLVNFGLATNGRRKTIFRTPEAALDSLLKKYPPEGGN